MVLARLQAFALLLLGVCCGGAVVAANQPAGTAAAKAPPTAGVGIALKLGKEYLEVARILPGTPAALSGKIHPGDRVIAIGEGIAEPASTKRMSINTGVSIIRGEPGTIVALTILQANKPDREAFVVTLTRGTIAELTRFGDGEYLAVGSRVPELKGIALPNGTAPEAIKATAGRVTVLEFWSIGCTPCLKAIDHLQELRKSHPQWKDQVSFVAVGVDEAKDDPANYVASHEQKWSGLTAVWSGSGVLKDFHVDGLPVLYVIDREGKVVAAGHALDLPNVIEAAIKGLPAPIKPERPPIYNERADAKAEIAAALALAKREHKRVLLKFGGNWCGWCYKLHDVFTKNADVAPVLNKGFVLVLVDIGTNRELFKKYAKDEKEPSYPYLVVLDADGNVLRDQKTEPFEVGKPHDRAHDPAKVRAFLEKWSTF